MWRFTISIFMHPIVSFDNTISFISQLYYILYSNKYTPAFRYLFWVLKTKQKQCLRTDDAILVKVFSYVLLLTCVWCYHLHLRIINNKKPNNSILLHVIIILLRKVRNTQSTQQNAIYGEYCYVFYLLHFFAISNMRTKCLGTWNGAPE